jgi:hypothetical protein
MRRGLIVLCAVAAVAVIGLIIYANMSSLPAGFSEGGVYRCGGSKISKIEGGKSRYYSWPAYVLAGKPAFVDVATCAVFDTIPVGSPMPEK